MGIMAKKMEIATMGLYYIGDILGYIGILAKKLEATI